jgi:hypothetical protein
MSGWTGLHWLTLLVRLCSQVIFGLAPALTGLGVSAARTVKGKPGAASSNAEGRHRRFLVVTECVVGMCSADGAGLLMRNLTASSPCSWGSTMNAPAVRIDPSRT